MGARKQRKYAEALAAIERECVECKRAIKAGDAAARVRLDILRAIARGFRALIAGAAQAPNRP
jgi:hypothetical protein